MAQTVKTPPTMQQTWVRSLGWEDPLEQGMAFPPTPWDPHGQRSLAGCSLWGRKELYTTERLSTPTKNLKTRLVS